MSDGTAAQPQDNPDPELFNRVKEDVKQRKPLLAATLGGDPEILERVREYERSSVQVAHQAGLVAAKGEDIERLALLDVVTELYNHRAFVKEIKAEIARARRYKHHVALCMIVVDNFDTLIENYGPLTQDAVLKVVANVIRISIREVDTAARYAPMQFAIVLPQTTSAGAALVAERIRQRIANQVFSHNWSNFSITASVGVATFPDNGQDYEELIAKALEALECASDRGGDRVFTF